MTEEEDRFMTIREFFKSVLDDRDIQVFRMAFDGQCYASTAKRNARVSIGLPRTIVDGNLKALDDFLFFGVAIPREIIERLANGKEE